MPQSQILNFMNQPTINEQVDARDMNMAKGYADVRSSMANTQMQEMRNQSMREQGDILKNFEGQTDTKAFSDKMNTVNPGLTQKIEKHAASMDAGERAQMKEKYTTMASEAIFERDRLAKSGQGTPEDFKQLDQVISRATTVEQALNMTRSGGKGKETALMTNVKFMMDAGYGEKEAIEILNKSQGKTAKEYYQYIYTKVLDANMVEDEEAASIAQKAMERMYGKQAANRQSGNRQANRNAPPGFQSGAGPSSGNTDYTHLM